MKTKAEIVLDQIQNILRENGMTLEATANGAMLLVTEKEMFELKNVVDGDERPANILPFVYNENKLKPV